MGYIYFSNVQFKNYIKNNFFFKDCEEELPIISCSESTKYSGSYDCNKAFNGNEDDGWASNNEGDGAWIQLNLDTFYRLSKVMILQRYSERFKDVTLEFSVGATVDFTLGNSKAWEQIELDDNNITTDYVKIIGTNVYIEGYPGFAELKIFGCASGMTTNFEGVDSSEN